MFEDPRRLLQLLILTLNWSLGWNFGTSNSSCKSGSGNSLCLPSLTLNAGWGHYHFFHPCWIRFWDLHGTHLNMAQDSSWLNTMQDTIHNWIRITIKFTHQPEELWCRTGFGKIPPYGTTYCGWASEILHQLVVHIPLWSHYLQCFVVTNSCQL